MINLPTRQWVSKPLALNVGPFSRPTKHVACAYNPNDGWIYTCGGDYGRGSPANTSHESGNCEMWRYSVELHKLEMVQPYCRPPGQPQPNGADEVGWCWNSKAQRFIMHPGYMWGHSGACQNTDMLKGPLMEFDPVASSWIVSAVPVSPRGAEGNFTQYDPNTDALVRFCNAGPEAWIWSYGPKTWVRSKWPLPNLNFSDTGTTIDVDGRAIYLCTGNKLWRYNIDPKTIDDLGPTPQTTWAENKPVWDTVNKVLLWPCFNDVDNSTALVAISQEHDSDDKADWVQTAHLEGVAPKAGAQEYVHLHVYHPDTKTWEVDVVDGTGIKGRHAVFDPGNNCLWVAGNIWNQPHSTSVHLFRYGQATEITIQVAREVKIWQV